MLRELLSDELGRIESVDVAGWAATAPAAILEFTRVAPEIVVLDLELASGSGFDVLRAIREQSVDCFVVIYSGHDAPALRTRAAEEGASAFVSKAEPAACLLACVRAATADAE